MSNHHPLFLEADTWYTNEFDDHEAYYMTKVNETLSVLLQLQSGRKTEQAFRMKGPITVLMNSISQKLQDLQNDPDNWIKFISNEKDVSVIDHNNKIALLCIPYRAPFLFKYGNQERFFSISRSSILRICYYVPENPNYVAHFPFGDAKAYWTAYHTVNKSNQSGSYCRRHYIDMVDYRISVETLPSPFVMQENFMVTWKIFQNTDAIWLIKKNNPIIVKTYFNFPKTAINLNWENIYDAAIRDEKAVSQFVINLTDAAGGHLPDKCTLQLEKIVCRHM